MVETQIEKLENRKLEEYDNQNKNSPNSEKRNHLIRILQLSDIHLGDKRAANGILSRLDTDLKQQLKIDYLNYIVISGDIVNCATKEEYDAAYYLIDSLISRFALNRKDIIIAPGNHDMDRRISKDAYPFYSKHIQRLFSGSKAMCNEELHKKRFANFSNFYERITGEPYPLQYSEQYKLHLNDNDHILFFALNSCWRIDHLNPKLAQIDDGALNNAILKINEDAKKYTDWLKIVVWHHPIDGRDKIMNEHIMELLAVNGFQICMHGHIHESKEGYYRYDTEHGIHIIGAGTFGAPAQNQIPGIPHQYNLLILNPAEQNLTINTRIKPKLNGIWIAPKPNYTIPVNLKTADKKPKNHTAPELTSNFINRRSEQERLMGSLQNKKMILIRGIPGIGKTELAAKIWENLKDNNSKVYWRDIRYQDTFKTITTSLAEFLRSNGYNKLYEYIEERRGNDFSEIVSYIIEGLNSNQYVLFFDDYHKLSPKTNDRDISVKQEMDDLFSKLACSLRNSTIILTSFGIPDFVNMVDTKQKILDEEIVEFKPDTIFDYLLKENLELKSEQFLQIKKYIQHPMMLFFFASNAKNKSIDDAIEVFASDEYRDNSMRMLLDGLSNEEKEILNVMSLFRTPVDSDVLSLIINKNRAFNKNNVAKNILILKNKGLVKKKGNEYDLHDLLKEFCEKQIDYSERKGLHKSIGEYYISLEITAESFLEASYHLIKNYGEINDEIIEYFLRTDDNI